MLLYVVLTRLVFFGELDGSSSVRVAARWDNSCQIAVSISESVYKSPTLSSSVRASEDANTRYRSAPV